jgi:hypothetical protein
MARRHAYFCVARRRGLAGSDPPIGRIGRSTSICACCAGPSDESSLPSTPGSIARPARPLRCMAGSRQYRHSPSVSPVVQA